MGPWAFRAAVLVAFSASVGTSVHAETEAVRNPRVSAGVIAFASDRDGDLEIYVMEVGGGNVRQITDNSVDDHSPSWAPDGRRLAFTREPSTEDSDIYIVDVVTGRERRFAAIREHYEYAPDWSPGGRWIAFATESHLLDGGDAVALRVDRKRFRVISAQDENTINYDPAWSPDGKRVALLEAFDAPDLYVARFCCSHGYRKRALTNDGAYELNPVWSPDGTRILFGRTATGLVNKFGLYTISSRRTGPELVFEGPLDARPGAWSPSGEDIVFYARVPGTSNYDIYRVDAGGSGLVQLTDELSAEIHPDWNPRART